jgi:uncharacterized protein
MLSRRALLCGAGASAALGAVSASERRKLHEFSYAQVRLTDGPLAAMSQRLRRHYLSLDEDRLLKVYRQRAGLPAPGRDMGGWYDADGFVPGHLLGQFISGLSRIHANTGDPDAAAKVRRLVQGYGAAFERSGTPFASPKASDTWGCYVFDKYLIGMLDAASLAGVAEARTLLPRLVQAASGVLPDPVFDRAGVKQPPYDEPYVLPENFFGAAALTGDRRYLELAGRYLLDSFFDPLANGDNVLPGRHGYSHVIALSSAAKAYEVLGDPKYLRAIRNAWDMIEQTQQYASGAWAADETFVRPRSGELAATLTRTRNHFETPCCFYAYAKLARYLSGFTGEARYGDGLERALLNTLLGALDPDDDGGYFYYSDYHAGARKGYYKMKWPCCAGTLLQAVADFPLGIYFHDGSGVYVNLYAGSEVRWSTKGIAVKLTQVTAYPESETIAIHVDAAAPVAFTVHLRIPGWLERPAQVTVNGKTEAIRREASGFGAISRRWSAGDVIELRLPFSTRTIPIEERAPDTVAVMRGPVMLTAIDPPQDLTVSAGMLKQMAPVAGAPLEFDAQTLGSKVRLRPFYRVQREVYDTYFRVAPA